MSEGTSNRRRSATVLAALLAAATVAPIVPSAEDAAPAIRKTLVVLGDSIAAGYGIAPERAYPALIQERIKAEGLPVTVVNAGVSGDTTAGGRRRVGWLLRRPADFLLIELGGNDGLRGIQPEVTRDNLTAIIRQAREKRPGIRIVLAGMQMPANMGPDYTAAFQQVFPEVAKEHDVALVPFLLEGIGADPRFNQPDLIHPNAEGHAVVADNVWTILGPILRGEPEPESGADPKPDEQPEARP